MSSASGDSGTGSTNGLGHVDAVHGVDSVESTDFAEAAVLFDAYRVHYGQPTDPAGTAQWLAGQVAGGLLTLAVALRDDRPHGLITTVTLPASLRLGSVCSIRDLYVAPGHRRGGTGRALLSHVINEARKSGALRVSLQTEPENTAAQALYASLGFRPVHGVDILNLPITSA